MIVLPLGVHGFLSVTGTSFSPTRILDDPKPRDSLYRSYSIVEIFPRDVDSDVNCLCIGNYLELGNPGIGKPEATNTKQENQSRGVPEP